MARTPVAPSPASEAWRLMTELVRSQDRREEAASAVGISFLRLKALSGLVAGPMALREVAARCAVDAPYATVMVDDLVELGYVTREPHPTDRRSRLVTITPLGIKAARQSEAILYRPPVSMAALSDSDVETLRRILARIVPA